jgi:hypothetical protein
MLEASRIGADERHPSVLIYEHLDVLAIEPSSIRAIDVKGGGPLV